MFHSKRVHGKVDMPKEKSAKSAHSRPLCTCRPPYPRAVINPRAQFWGTIAALSYSCSCGQYVPYMSASDMCRLWLVQQYQNVRLDDPVLPIVSLQQYGVIL